MATSLIYQHPPTITYDENNSSENEEIGLLEIIEISIETLSHIREEVLDRLYSLLRMINKPNTNIIQSTEFDYQYLLDELKDNFTFSKAFTVINMMLDDNFIVNCPNIHTMVFEYEKEIKHIIVNANTEHYMNKQIKNANCENNETYDKTYDKIIEENIDENIDENQSSEKIQIENCDETVV